MIEQVTRPPRPSGLTLSVSETTSFESRCRERVKESNKVGDLEDFE